MTPRAFLKAELSNLRGTLEGLLRFDYGPSGSQRFYEECLTRIGDLERAADEIAPKANKDLQTLVEIVAAFARRVHSIERANETEVSWPFVEATKKLAEGLLTEAGPPQVARRPLILALAAGGLDSYSILLEDPSQDPYVRTPIHFIEFPRTLRHHVLVHAIFAHEVGHAACSTPHLVDYIENKIFAEVQASGPLSNSTAFSKWIKTRGSDDQRDLDSRRLSWTEEIFCDLFGLVCFGPSYAYAFKTVVHTVDPTRLRLNIDHPPVVVRDYVLGTAWKILGWDAPSLYGSGRRASTFASGPFGSLNVPSWAKTLMTPASIGKSLAAIQKLPVGSLPLVYPVSDASRFQELVQMLFNWIPPCGVNKFKDNGDLFDDVDFRTILAAGWSAWVNDALSGKSDDERFRLINQLSELGIAQQLVIAEFSSKAKAPT